LQLRLLPLPSLRRLHVLFIPVSASSLAELDIIQADLLRASQLLIEPSARAAAEAEALVSGSGLPPSPSPPLDIWAGLQLVAESTTGNADEEVLRDGKQIGAGEVLFTGPCLSPNDGYVASHNNGHGTQMNCQVFHLHPLPVFHIHPLPIFLDTQGGYPFP